MKRLDLINIAVMGSELALAWSDQSETYVTFETLRKACPCAACQGEPDVTGKVELPRVHHTDKSFQLLRHDLVGGYAVQFTWADGHRTGIYSYDLLRALG